MNDATSQNALFYALCLILPLSALLARRLPIRHVAKMAIAWIAIFALGLLLATQRHRVAAAWSGIHTALFGTSSRISGTTMRIPMAEDGHFWADVSINGATRRMLIDSGATTTAISAATAAAAGIRVDESGFPEIISTANGTIAALPGRAARVTIGSLSARDLPVIVSPAFGDTNVIGMNFLSQLQAWRVEGRDLVLVPIDG
ncbi:TIGR02281 family clan AA aspartic protease [Hephaestia sp. GCM10023244]|uniref:retropepsin-like aspartic protease family protein n=1 Tax=unclassified Hephaestia TaxID=2631281 RepID=UPI00207740F2|nr:TIGR02281 family clan AA aspartic protease [Hephaestia sp. MAHUQ-44]MCM8731411.1 TIGR02281 family clan AA aspartic protease [Hephaestia sp. MAHUQ-44]